MLSSIEQEQDASSGESIALRMHGSGKTMHCKHIRHWQLPLPALEILPPFSCANPLVLCLKFMLARRICAAVLARVFIIASLIGCAAISTDGRDWVFHPAEAEPWRWRAISARERRAPWLWERTLELFRTVRILGTARALFFVEVRALVGKGHGSCRTCITYQVTFRIKCQTLYGQTGGDPLMDPCGGGISNDLGAGLGRGTDGVKWRRPRGGSMEVRKTRHGQTNSYRCPSWHVSR